MLSYKKKKRPMSKEKEIKAEQTMTENETLEQKTAEDTVQDSDNELTPEKEIDPLEKANDEIAELKDKYLRTLAEFENYKRRSLKEKTELILNGGEKVITAILPVLDDMERAIANANKADTKESVEEGWELICKKLHKILEGIGVKRIDTENTDFNVDYHEAIAMVPGMGDEMKGKVIDCTQAGYMLNEKVIRHAKVAVGQ